MNYKYWLLRLLKTIGLPLLVGLSMTACSDASSWKEEVLLHDGSKLVVERTQTFGGRHEIGQSPPIKEHWITFTPPGAKKPITWKSEFSEDVGNSNFTLLALDFVDGVPYIVANPTGCLAYNKWGRPNPPYVFFKYVGAQWKRIPLEEFPHEIDRPNMLIDTYGFYDVDHAIESGFVAADMVNKLNAPLTQEELKSIVKVSIKHVNGDCGVMVHCGQGKWLSIDWFTSAQTYEACNKICERESVAAQQCPCNKLFKEESK